MSNINTENAIPVAKVFEPIFESDKKDFVLEAGRDSGKSKTAYILSGIHSAKYPNEDIVICRASYGSIGDSCYNEMTQVLDSIPQFDGMFIYRKSPLRIVRKGGGTNIYFMGVGGSTDRTKGINPIHKVGLVIIEETQELKTKEHLDQTLASLRRRFGDNTKVVIIFNPPAIELHWINIWANSKRNDADYVVLHPTYLDILPFLNDRDIKEILKTKYESEVYYNYMYMGIPCSSEGLVYPMFNKSRHIISMQEYEYIIHNTNIRPVLCVMGCDGAVTRDATSVVPLIVLSNGQSVIAPIYYHNPKENGVLSYHTLVEQQITRWFDNLCRMFFLGSREEIRIAQERQVRINIVPCVMRVDSAAPDLVRELQFFLSDRINIAAIHKKTVLEMVGVVQSAIANDSVIIIDYGGYYDYTKNKFIERSPNILVEQICTLIWNKQQTNYDPIVPNDVCDAFTYGTFFWYANIENMKYFDAIKINSINYEKIGVILKKRQEGESI